MSNNIYFVPKGKIIEWINELLPNNRINKIEQLSQDSLWPGTISFTKAHYNAINEYEKEENFKIIQQALTKHNIDQYCDPAKLAKGKMQDNLEFAQWFKFFFDKSFDYDQYLIDDQKVKQKFGKKMSNTVVEELTQTTLQYKLQEQKQKQKQAEQSSIQSAKLKSQQQQLKFMQEEQEKIATQQQHLKMQEKLIQEEQRRVSQQQILQLEEEKLKFQEEIENLKEIAEKRKKESQFYFSKLREIEIYCGKIRDQISVQKDEKIEEIVDFIEKILFAEFKN